MGGKVSMDGTVTNVAKILQDSAVSDGGITGADFSTIKKHCVQLFHYYDKDGSGVLERKEMELLAKDLDTYIVCHATNAASRNPSAKGSIAKGLIEEWDKDDNNKLTKDEFIIGIIRMSKQVAKGEKF